MIKQLLTNVFSNSKRKQQVSITSNGKKDEIINGYKYMAFD